jgi:hypothetical protein
MPEQLIRAVDQVNDRVAAGSGGVVFCHPRLDADAIIISRRYRSSTAWRVKVAGVSFSEEAGRSRNRPSPRLVQTPSVLPIVRDVDRCCEINSRRILSILGSRRSRTGVSDPRLFSAALSINFDECSPNPFLAAG